jgi:type I restriction enzyme M protein
MGIPLPARHDPEEFLRQYQVQQQRIQALRDRLKSVLADTLERDA